MPHAALSATRLPPLRGFDAEFRDLDHYIRVITERIWEGRQIEAIRQWYGDPCPVLTPGGLTTRIDDVISGTLLTLQQFPDRRLLAEDVVPYAADDGHWWLSSHRIISTMTHQGEGPFGVPRPADPTRRPIQVRTVADCVCHGNRIVHEWLVRDQGAIARQIGTTPRALARRWLDAREGAPPVPRPDAPPPAAWRDPMQDDAAHPAAQLLAALYRGLWSGGDAAVGAAVRSACDEAIDWRGPGNDQRYGHLEVQAFWSAWTAAFPGAQLTIDSLLEHRREGRLPVVAMRWRLQGRHHGDGLFGAASGRPVDVLGITHAEVLQGRVLREWVLLDEVSLWMQLLPPSQP